MIRALKITIATGLLLATAACGCSPGHVGPYGGVHPGRCWVG